MTDSTIPARPNGMHVMTPHLICRNAAEMMKFYKEAFDTEEMFCLPGNGGKIMNASLKLFGTSIMLVDEEPDYGYLSPRSLQGTPVTIHLYVNDADAVMEKAIAAGATVILPLENMFWGDRYGVIEDPSGHRWSIATHIRDVSTDEMREGVMALRA
ncbi:MAG: VOC family protein [Alphaproteobacteria bacterium]|nr:MAG: VOC family protein [Alphaproteobacteria bacterium]